MVGTLIRRPLGFVSSAWQSILAQTTPTAAFTPTAFNTTNIDASTVGGARYVRLGDTVIVAGYVEIDPTAAAPTTTVLGLSIPVASAFTVADQLNGVATAFFTNTVGEVFADTVNDRASIRFQATSASNAAWHYVYMYQVL